MSSNSLFAGPRPSVDLDRTTAAASSGGTSNPRRLLADLLGLNGHSSSNAVRSVARKSRKRIAVAGTEEHLESGSESDYSEDEEPPTLPRIGLASEGLVGLSRQLDGQGQTVGVGRRGSVALRAFELAMSSNDDEISVLAPQPAFSLDFAATQTPAPASEPYTPSYSILSITAPKSKKYARLPPELIPGIVSRLVKPRDLLAAGKLGRDWWAVAKHKLYSSIRLPTSQHIHLFITHLERFPRGPARSIPELTSYPLHIPIPGLKDSVPWTRRAAKASGKTEERIKIGVLDLSSPLLSSTFSGPTELWTSVTRLLALLPPKSVGRIILPHAPLSRSTSLAPLSLVSGSTSIDASGLDSPWFTALLSALAHSAPTRLKLGDGRQIHDSPEPVTGLAHPLAAKLTKLGLGKLARLLRQPAAPQTPEDPTFLPSSLVAASSALCRSLKHLSIELGEMGVWWSTSNLRILLTHLGPSLESFGIKLGGAEPTWDERDVEVRRKWFGAKQRREEEEARRRARKSEGVLGMASWSYGDETEFSVILSLLLDHAPHLHHISLDLGGLVPMQIPLFVAQLVQLLSRSCSRVSKLEMRVGDGVWRALKTEGFGEVPHAHVHVAHHGHGHAHAHGVPHRRGSISSVHGHHGHHLVHAAKGAPLSGFVGKVEGGWFVVEKKV